MRSVWRGKHTATHPQHSSAPPSAVHAQESTHMQWQNLHAHDPSNYNYSTSQPCSYFRLSLAFALRIHCKTTLNKGVYHSLCCPLQNCSPSHCHHSTFTNHSHTRTCTLEGLLRSVFALFEARSKGIQLLPQRNDLLLLLWKGIRVG